MAVGPTGPVWPPWCQHPCQLCRQPPYTHSSPRQNTPSFTANNRRWRRRRPRRARGEWRAPLDSSSSASASSSEDEAPHLIWYHSDTETTMPGGFENSAMKSSFSLSSLQPSSISLESPEHARPERPYNSLRKSCRRKDPEQELWRRSWDRKDTKDEFWNALEPNYLYLMDSNLIDSCKEAGRDLHYGPSPSHDWSYEQFCGQFKDLDLWLTTIQETIYSKEDTNTDRNLRLSHIEEMHRKVYKRKVFNNQGGRLAAKCPQLQGEVKWRVELLNRKWERLEQTGTPRKRAHPDHITYALDVEHDIKFIREWVKLTDRRLQPIKFHTTWTLKELEAKAKEHQVIQQEVELHGKVISSLLKKCDRLLQAEAEAEGSSSPLPPLLSRERHLDCYQTLRYARDLKRRWEHLYLRNLEWICYIDEKTERVKDRSPTAVSSAADTDDCEPVLKHPRLSTSPCPPYQPSPHSQDVEDEQLMEVSTSSANDMVGPQPPSELSVSMTANYPPTSPSLLNRSGSGSMQITSSVDVLNKNYAIDLHARRLSMPTDTARKLFPEEISKFTTSARPSPNNATYYFKHRDTESEQDESQMDQSSEEDEWTFQRGDGEEGEGDESPPNDDGSLCHSTETLASASKSLKQEPVIDEKLQRLIEGAEVMVTPIRKPRVFQALKIDGNGKGKVKDWMMKNNWNTDGSKEKGSALTDASYDGSAEEEERQSSGDFNSCNTHCHQSADTLTALDSPLVDKTPAPLVSSTPEHKAPPVVLRVRRKEGTPQRPLSESGLPQQLAQQKLLQSLSQSESALNHLEESQSTTPTQSVKMDTSVQGTLSSSTTMEELPGQAREGSGGSYSSNSLNRRRKNKLRKRNVGRKSNSGSDGHDPPSPLKSVPALRRASTSCTESEEEVDGGDSKTRSGRKKQLAQPLFKLGHIVTVFPTADKTLSADSSFSEQAWDSFQEKYHSEAYSEEVPDQETTRRLLEFGDDYRNFLDSQSDGASSLGMGRPAVNRRRRTLHWERDCSDSEGTEVRILITKSQEQWTWCDRNWNNISIGSPHLVFAKEFAEMISTCKENISVLTKFLVKCEKAKEFVEESQEIRGLIGQWEGLELRTEELQRARSLQREMAGLREEMLELSKRLSLSSQEMDSLQDRSHLDRNIQTVQGEQSNLREHKTRLIEVNTAVHKFFTCSGQQGVAVEQAHRLKEDVKELYLVWEDTNKRATQQLDRLNQLSAAWKTFETHLKELKLALRGDHNTLRMLDSALQEGPVSQDVASSVSIVAKVLSEKQDLCQSVCALSSTTPVILIPPASAEGSLSGVESGTDSGISDSGSEQESERERRLSDLRRLARQLAAVLSPNSQAIIDMARSIEQTEVELRDLQKTCRELIVRTAVCADAKLQDSPSHTPLPPPTLLANRKGKNLTSVPQNFMDLDPDDDDPEPGKGSGWLWRVIRAALPFQMAILAIFCVACLLEPHCCDSMNNLNFSLTPQLRYTRGPPPV